MTLYANTLAFSRADGSIDDSIYTDAELKQLTTIAYGDQFNGNANFERVYTERVYKNGTSKYSNLVGADGVLKLYNDSKMLPKAAESAVADFWNHVAGEEVVRFVNVVENSDEVIHDVAGDNGVLGAQTYNGNGLIMYPDSWHIDHLTAEQQENYHMATVIHEIGHALGIPHLGGGNDGTNAANAVRFGNEVMGPWSILDHPDGIQNTLVDAAALAIAALTWRKPRKLATWIFSDNASEKYVIYKNRGVKTNLSMKPSVKNDWGVKFDWNLIQSPIVTYRTIAKNYNLYQFEPEQIDGKTYSVAKQVGYTGNPNQYRIGMTIKILAVYPTDDPRVRVVRFKDGDEELTMYEAALDQPV
ncbi:hypothetical protein [Weissella minor]|uniref:Uncharacterized protein n=1 Tax=Weissella minor TaxID=1620 RepID=A0A0R2JP34_9LACO|nr:hypothetical protein [Weissella minor]KRN76620.1 hypothetical protein IV67_GL000121 [Weissella minor]